jgi:acetate kinase
VGQRSPLARARVLTGLSALGIALDEQRNATIGGDEAGAISTEESPVAVLVIPTDEEWEIARQTLAVVRRWSDTRR